MFLLNGPKVRATVDGLGPSPRGFANRISECLEVITCGTQRIEIELNANNFPASRCREALAVELAQVVAVRFRRGSQRAKDRGGVRVDICQRRYSRARTGGLRATSTGGHEW